MRTTHPIPEVKEELAPRLRWAITRMARRLRQEAGTDLGPSQVAALATIERHGPLSPSELAERERIKHPEDGRASILSATPDARELLKRLRARKTAYLAKRLSAMDAQDRRTLER